MKKLNQKLIWLVFALPLTGCGTLTSIPLYEKKPDAVQIVPVVERVNPSPLPSTVKAIDVDVDVEVKAHPIDNAIIEVKKTDKIENIAPPTAVVSVTPLDPEEVKNLKAQVGDKQVLVDPNVKLIAPPTALPRTKYAVPQVEEKEDYTPKKYVSNKKSKKNKISSKKSHKSKSATNKKNSKKSVTKKNSSKSKTK